MKSERVMKSEIPLFSWHDPPIHLTLIIRLKLLPFKIDMQRRPLNCIDTSALSNFFKLFWAHLIHILGAPDEIHILGAPDEIHILGAPDPYFDASSLDFSQHFDLKITIL
jgi:hypothetical protein